MCKSPLSFGSRYFHSLTPGQVSSLTIRSNILFVAWFTRTQYDGEHRFLIRFGCTMSWSTLDAHYRTNPAGRLRDSPFKSIEVGRLWLKMNWSSREISEKANSINPQYVYSLESFKRFPRKERVFYTQRQLKWFAWWVFYQVEVLFLCKNLF